MSASDFATSNDTDIFLDIESNSNVNLSKDKIRKNKSEWKSKGKEKNDYSQFINQKLICRNNSQESLFQCDKFPLLIVWETSTGEIMFDSFESESDSETSKKGCSEKSNSSSSNNQFLGNKD